MLLSFFRSPALRGSFSSKLGAVPSLLPDTPLHILLSAVLSQDFESVRGRIVAQLGLTVPHLKGAVGHQRMRFEAPAGCLDVLVSSSHRCLLLRSRPRQEELFLVPLSDESLALGVRTGLTEGPLAALACAVCDTVTLRRDTGTDPHWPDFDAWEELVTRDESGPREAPEARSGEAVREEALMQAAVAERDDEIRTLKWRIRQLEQAASAPALDPSPATAAEPGSFPASLAELERWASRYAEQLVILPRALKGARKSHYEDPARVFRAVQYLAEDYWRHKRGELSLAENEQALLRAGVSLSGSTTASVAGMQGEQYFVAYQGERLFLDQHLVRGGGTDPRFCMRVYFTWHAPTRRVVVGWLPSHLSNTLS